MSRSTAKPVAPNITVPTSASAAGPASRMATELKAVLRSTNDLQSLRHLCLDCILRYRSLVGAAWYVSQKDNLAAAERRFDHPALQHQPLQDWIEANCLNAARQGHDIVVRSSEVRNLALIALPLQVADGKPEVLAVLIANPDDPTIEKETLAAHNVVDAARAWGRSRTLMLRERQLRTTAALLELTGEIESALDVQQASRVLVDRLKDHLKCDLVAVGLCSTGKQTTRLSAVAGLAEIDENSSRARQIKAAIDEAIVRDEVTVCNAASEHPHAHQMLAHQKLATSASMPIVISTPLKNAAGDLAGALIVAGTDAMERPEVQELLQTIEVPIGGALQCVRRNQRGIVRRFVGRVMAKNPQSKAIAAVMVLSAAILILMLPVPYRIACPFLIEPMERRFCVAPYDGLLRQTLVEPGEVVQAGQILATMDDAEMRFELAGLSADVHRAGKQRDVHLAGEKIADSLMAALDVDRIESRSQLLQHRLDTRHIRSKFDGIVLAGSMERGENFPVEIGQTLYEVAPLDELMLEVAVPAIEMDHVQVGMTVKLRVSSSPADVYSGTIHSVRPRSEIVDDQNVFIAEVRLTNPDQKLRPGLEGTARVISNCHPLGWNLFHRAYDYIVVNWVW